VRGADHRRCYLYGNCSLVFSDPEHYFSLTQEKAFNLNHENSIKNPGYVNFLNRVVQPMLSRLDCSIRGLDYGCGHGSTLSRWCGGAESPVTIMTRYSQITRFGRPMISFLRPRAWSTSTIRKVKSAG